MLQYIYKLNLILGNCSILTNTVLHSPAYHWESSDKAVMDRIVYVGSLFQISFIMAILWGGVEVE